jgi:hypothetical protein
LRRIRAPGVLAQRRGKAEPQKKNASFKFISPSLFPKSRHSSFLALEKVLSGVSLFPQTSNGAAESRVGSVLPQRMSRLLFGYFAQNSDLHNRKFETILSKQAADRFLRPWPTVDLG